MTPEELQSNYVETVLYYISLFENTRFLNSTHGQIAPEIGESYFPVQDVPILEMKTWLLVSCDMPENDLLVTYDLETVLNFFTNKYDNPSKVKQSQPFAQLTSEQIASLELTNINEGSFVIKVLLRQKIMSQALQMV